jgi:hypothetical protein
MSPTLFIINSIVKAIVKEILKEDAAFLGSGMKLRKIKT